jgi:predicted SAM-dependent methyltransferase
LDLGCAAGNISQFMLNKNNYYGVDYNEDFEVFGKKHGLKIKVCDLTLGKLPFEDNFFDVIYFRHVIEHLQAIEQVKIMKEIHRVLKKEELC